MIRPACTRFLDLRLFAGIALLGTASLISHQSALAQEIGSGVSVGDASSISLHLAPGHEDPTQSTIQAPAGRPTPSPLNVGTADHMIHIRPTVEGARALSNTSGSGGPLLYHGGPVMNPSVTIYPIFWLPAHLQNGGATYLSSHYLAVEYYMLKDFPGHGLGAIATQYYSKSGSSAPVYIQNVGGLDSKGTYFTDSSPYPTSGCHDSYTPGNCLSDAQIRAEIQKILTFGKLTGGLNKIYMLFTSSGEGSCFSSASTSCSYSQYCAYHSHFTSGTSTVIYANEPYGYPPTCQVNGAPSPNGDPAADAAATSASHELSESITDPDGNAWFASNGSENGDICAYTYGSVNWDGGYANQMWNGHYYLLQQEYSNHTYQCLSAGP